MAGQSSMKTRQEIASTLKKLEVGCNNSAKGSGSDPHASDHHNVHGVHHDGSGKSRN